MPDSFASLAARIEAALKDVDPSRKGYVNQAVYGRKQDARAALAEMKERAEKLEAGLLAVNRFWTTPEFIAMQQAAMLAAALSSPETPE